MRKSQSLQDKTSSKSPSRTFVIKPNQKKKLNLKPQIPPSDSESEEVIGNHYTMFSANIFRGNKYMPKFIKAIEGNETMCKCIKCKDSKNGVGGKELLVNSVYLHIQSKKHRANTPQNEIAQLDQLIETIENFVGRKKKVKQIKKAEENSYDTEQYLKFLGFLMSQNLSYSQIQGIGNYLKERAKEENLGFLKKYSFEEQLLSKISKDCFRPYYTENLKKN